MIPLSIAECSPNIRAQLTGNQLNILDDLLGLIQSNATKRHVHSGYAWCSEEWLASQSGICRVTVSRTIQTLQHLGLIRCTHRRKVNGHWTTNLYQLGPKLWRTLQRLLRQAQKGRKSAEIGRVTSMCHIVSTPQEKLPTTDAVPAWLVPYIDRYGTADIK